MGGQAKLLAHPLLVVHGLRLQAVVFWNVAMGEVGGRAKVRTQSRSLTIPMSHASSQFPTALTQERPSFCSNLDYYWAHIFNPYIHRKRAKIKSKDWKRKLNSRSRPCLAVKNVFLPRWARRPGSKQLTCCASLPGNAILEFFSSLIVDGDGYPGICVKGELDIVVDLSFARLFPMALYFLSTSGKSQSPHNHNPPTNTIPPKSQSPHKHNLPTITITPNTISP